MINNPFPITSSEITLIQNGKAPQHVSCAYDEILIGESGRI